MKPIFAIIRPAMLDDGRKYLLRVHYNNGRDPDYIPVKFVGYDSCPAWVIVRDGDGNLLRIPRDDVYTYEISDYTLC